MIEAPPLILFDIDGTLLRVGDKEHGAAFIHAFERVYGRPVTLDGVSLAGMLDAQIARVLFDRHGLSRDEADARLREMMDAMGTHYVESIVERDTRSRLLPGASDAVRACVERGWTTGVLTGNGRAVGEAKLRAAGLTDCLTFGAFGDSAAERGHLVEAAIEAAFDATGARHEPSRTVLVGDTPNDIAAARLGGAHVLAVATGRYDVGALSDCAPDAVLPDLADTGVVVTTIEALLRDCS